jgi:hypothetical protein
MLYSFFWVVPLYTDISETLYSIFIGIWRWKRHSVSKRRHIKFRSRGITQKKAYNTLSICLRWQSGFHLSEVGITIRLLCIIFLPYLSYKCIDFQNVISFSRFTIEILLKNIVTLHTGARYKEMKEMKSNWMHRIYCNWSIDILLNRNTNKMQLRNRFINQRLQIQFRAPDDEMCAARNMLSLQ